VFSSDLPGVNPATLNGMILYYCLMTKWSGLSDSTELSRMGLSHRRSPPPPPPPRPAAAVKPYRTDTRGGALDRHSQGWRGWWSAPWTRPPSRQAQTAWRSSPPPPPTASSPSLVPCGGGRKPAEGWVGVGLLHRRDGRRIIRERREDMTAHDSLHLKGPCDA
jgi:hypothetical protein